MAHGTLWQRSASAYHLPQFWNATGGQDINVVTQDAADHPGSTIVRTIMSANLSVRCPDDQLVLLDPFDWTYLAIAACTGYSSTSNFQWPNPTMPFFDEVDRVTGTACLLPAAAYRNRDNTGWIFDYKMDEVIDTKSRRRNPETTGSIISCGSLWVVSDPGFMFAGSVASFTVSVYMRTLFEYPI